MSTPEEKEKRRRRMKRRSKIAHDLHSKKYRQRVIPSKKVRDSSDDSLYDDEYLYLDDVDYLEVRHASRAKREVLSNN